MWEEERREGERKDSCNTFSLESAANFPRATTPERTLSWSVQGERGGGVVMEGGAVGKETLNLRMRQDKEGEEWRRGEEEAVMEEEEVKAVERER